MMNQYKKCFCRKLIYENIVDFEFIKIYENKLIDKKLIVKI